MSHAMGYEQAIEIRTVLPLASMLYIRYILGRRCAVVCVTSIGQRVRSIYNKTRHADTTIST